MSKDYKIPLNDIPRSLSSGAQSGIQVTRNGGECWVVTTSQSDIYWRNNKDLENISGDGPTTL